MEGALTLWHKRGGASHTPGPGTSRNLTTIPKISPATSWYPPQKLYQYQNSTPSTNTHTPPPAFSFRLGRFRSSSSLSHRVALQPAKPQKGRFAPAGRGPKKRSPLLPSFLLDLILSFYRHRIASLRFNFASLLGQNLFIAHCSLLLILPNFMTNTHYVQE
jgi:hypothetical protein